MNTCKRFSDVERWFDTKQTVPGLDDHLAACAVCADHLEFLQTTRSILESEAAGSRDHRVDSERFLIDLRERIEAAPRTTAPRWAWVSLAAAACVVALSLISIVSTGPQAVDARSYVDSVETSIEGATTETYHADDGTAIVWVNVPEGDMW